MAHLDRSFDSLDSKAEIFHAAQTRQVELQSRLHDQLQIEMQTTRGLLDEATSSATSLKATVDSTAALVGKLSSLTDITRWIPTVGVGVMLLLALYLIYPTYAGYLATAISKRSGQDL